MESEKLKPEEFDAHIKNGTCRIAFIGMSNAGKSYRSRVLQNNADFLWYQVDAEIEKALGFKNIEEVSAWIGYPSNETYKERERKYLELEKEFTEHAAMQTKGKNLVFDTTGSVVHLAPETLQILHENCLVIHMEIGQDSMHHMVDLFFKEPKPVAWGEYFAPDTGESSEEALKRCYPGLLESRLLKYRKLAHMNIPAEEFFDKTAEETLALIRSHLV